MTTAVMNNGTMVVGERPRRETPRPSPRSCWTG